MIRPTGISLLGIVTAFTLTSCDKIAAPLPSLKTQTGHFRPTLNAPESRFTPAGEDSATGEKIVDSSFGPTAAVDSEFRLAEVAPDRLEQTRTLLSQLDAKQDADQAIHFSLPADVLFDFDKATLRPDAQAPLHKAQQLIAAYPKAPITIIGYTDAKGGDVYNDRLSMARARAVAVRLVGDGDRHANVKGYGEHDPVAPNAHTDGSDDPEGRQRNRRVEIILLPVPANEKD